MRFTGARWPLDGDVVAFRILERRDDLPLFLVDRDGAVRHQAVRNAERVPRRIDGGRNGHGVLENETLDDVFKESTGSLLFLAESS